MSNHKFSFLAALLYAVFLEVFLWGSVHKWRLDPWLSFNCVMLALGGWIIPIILWDIES